MAPSTTQHSSPPQETAFQKRTLRQRGSNAGVGATSSVHSDVIASDRDGDLKGGDAEDGHAHDARGVNGVDVRKRKRSSSSSEVVHREKRGSPGKVKETPEQIQFKQLLKEIAIVLTSGDSDPSVLRYPLPAPSEISVSPNGKRTNQSESAEPVRTIAFKLEANEYTHLNQLEDDLQIAAKGLMGEFPINTEPYNKVAFFFAFARDVLLDRQPPDTKQAHTLRSSMTNGTSSVQIPAARPPLRQALYTMGPKGPLFTSIAARDVSATIANALPSSLSLPTSTGGSFTASTTAIIPNNPMNASSRRLADTSRKPASFPHRKRGDFSDFAPGKVQTTKWLAWGSHASFAPDWDDGGVGGGYGAEESGLDWAYRRLKKKARKRKEDELPQSAEKKELAPEPIDEKLLLEWTEEKFELEEMSVQEEEDESAEMTIDETLQVLRQMVVLLGQMQTLRIAMGKEISEDERSLAKNILSTFQNLILTYSIPPNVLMSSLPKEAYNIITLTHPEYTGSLPPRKIPSWAPPPTLPPQQPPQQLYPPRSQAPYTPQPRLTAQQQQSSQRLLPGPSSYPRNQPLTPAVRGPYNTPASTPGGYSSSPGNQIAPPPRGVGRPRKYDIRR